ncbi:hypothetical protein Tco_0039685 [Tanacetum coccineum]
MNLHVPQEGSKEWDGQRYAVKVMEYQIGHQSIKDEEVYLVDGVLKGALGALGDDSLSVGDRVFVSSWVKSTNNYFGGMMLVFGRLEALEIEALVDVMDIDSG